MLTLQAVNAGYRRLQILHAVDLEVQQGEIVALIGANGAGKTTTLRAISGLCTVTGGRITLNDRRIDTTRPDMIVRQGLVHVPQDRGLFGRLTVIENLHMGAYSRRHGSDRRDLDMVFDLFPILRDRRNQRADTMSGGQQQMLAIGRALMAKPTLLTLDEPSIGLAPNLVMQIFETIQRIRQAGVTILIVEQNAVHTLKLADRAYVMESGAITLHGAGRELVEDDRVKTAYLGM